VELTSRFWRAPTASPEVMLRTVLTYQLLFSTDLESRRADIGGISAHANEQWMQQMAGNATMEGCGALRYCGYFLHDRDAKYSAGFRAIIETDLVKPCLNRLEVQT
jgi:putative transposase